MSHPCFVSPDLLGPSINCINTSVWFTNFPFSCTILSIEMICQLIPEKEYEIWLNLTYFNANLQFYKVQCIICDQRFVKLIFIYITISTFTSVRPYGVRPSSVPLLSFIIFRVLDAKSNCCWARQSRAMYRAIHKGYPIFWPFFDLPTYPSPIFSNSSHSFSLATDSLKGSMA